MKENERLQPGETATAILISKMAFCTPPDCMPHLLEIQLRDFALIDHAVVELANGFHVLTGESGAGKSLLLQALELALGGRSDASLIRAPSDKLEVSLVFDAGEPSVERWLEDQGLNNEDELMIRRQVSDAGRSRAWVSGSSMSVNELKHLGDQLCVLGAQHAQMALLKPRNIEQWYDRVNQTARLAAELSALSSHWRTLKNAQQRAEQASESRRLRIEELEEQLGELSALSMPYDQLEIDHERATSQESLATELLHIQQLIDDGDHSAFDLLRKAKRLSEAHSLLQSVHELLGSAAEAVQEASREMSRIDVTPVSPVMIEKLEHELSTYHRLAKKHDCKPSELKDRLQILQTELDELLSLDVTKLGGELDRVLDEWRVLSADLHLQREQGRAAICDQLARLIQPLSMPEARFEVRCTPPGESPDHAPHVELIFSANKGMELKPLGQIASGGELSRLTLVMQILDATSDDTRLLVFDEIDAGLSGAAAEAMGQMLKDLGRRRQVLAISHQPQVAACADRHLLVKKDHGGEMSVSSIETLSGEARVHELARMAGGQAITQTTLDHAAELLRTQQRTKTS